MYVSACYRTSILKDYEKSVKTALKTVFSHITETGHTGKLEIQVLK